MASCCTTPNKRCRDCGAYLSKGGPETQILDFVRHFGWAVADAGIYFVSFHSVPLAGASSQINFYSFETRSVVQVGTIEPELP